jgi:hypothetical protein
MTDLLLEGAKKEPWTAFRGGASRALNRVARPPCEKRQLNQDTHMKTRSLSETNPRSSMPRAHRPARGGRILSTLLLAAVAAPDVLLTFGREARLRHEGRKGHKLPSFQIRLACPEGVH